MRCARASRELGLGERVTIARLRRARRTRRALCRSDARARAVALRRLRLRRRRGAVRGPARHRGALVVAGRSGRRPTRRWSIPTTRAGWVDGRARAARRTRGGAGARRASARTGARAFLLAASRRRVRGDLRERQP